MPNNIQPAQFTLFLLTTMLFASAFILGLRHMRRAADHHGIAPSSIGPASRTAIALATLFDLLLLLWRAATEEKLSLPLSNHFDAFLVLALLLAVMLIYFRWTRNLRGLSFFLLPMIVMLLLLGGALSIIRARRLPLWQYLDAAPHRHRHRRHRLLRPRMRRRRRLSARPSTTQTPFR